MSTIHETEIDGIPTYWTEGTGPFTAALGFRVGVADETYATGGITHLVEHLAMHAVDERPVENNAFVDLTETVFYATGRPGPVGHFLRDVCAALGELPTDRGELERQVLATEDAGSDGGARPYLLALRYGAKDYGLLGSHHLGLTWLDASHAQSWADRHFTRGNAVLWCVGEPPDDLRLPLRQGERVPLPEAEDVTAHLPAFDLGPPGGLALSVVSRPSTAHAAAVRMLERRLRRRLRRELGLSYHVEAGRDPVGRDTVHTSVIADCAPEREDDVVGAALEVIDRFRREGPDGDDLARDIEWVEEILHDPAEWLPAAAIEHLHGVEPITPQGYLEELRGLDPGRIGESFTASWQTALLIVPEDLDPPEQGFDVRHVPLAAAVTGREYRPKLVHRATSLRKGRLTVGDEGVTLAWSPDDVTTVRYDAVVALQRWEDGSRLLMAADGTSLALLPGFWQDEVEIMDRVEGAVPSERTVDVDDLLASPLEGG